jgi:hypothetical protein
MIRSIALAFLLSPLVSLGAATAPKPNVLFIVADDLCTHVGAYGNKVVQTPHFDALAARGVRFDRAYTVTPLTIPAHSSMHTGLYPPRHGVRDNGDFFLGDDAVTLAERLTTAGYKTMASVGAEVTSHHWGFAQGFGAFFDEMGPVGDDGNRWRVERPGAEVVNAAVPGYSTYQSLNVLDMRGWGLDPDLLLVANIWSDNNFDSFTDRELVASYAGWRSSVTHDLRLGLESSALFRWLDWTLRVAPQGERARKVGWQVGGTDRRTGNRRVDIASYAANLDAMCARMYARGGGVVFLMLANREDVEPLSDDPLGDTGENLATVTRLLQVELAEKQPDEARAARSEGFPDIASWFETVAHTRRGHLERLAEATRAVRREEER